MVPIIQYLYGFQQPCMRSKITFDYMTTNFISIYLYGIKSHDNMIGGSNSANHTGIA